MKTKTNVKAGGLPNNHNQRSLRTATSCRHCGLRVKTGIKAGVSGPDKNQDPPTK